jgi:cell division protein ZapA
MSEKTSLVNVDIFGQSYALRAGAEPGYVESLGAFVDRQMREVSRGAGTVDSVRIAVLAALNIADELFRLREAEGRQKEDVRQRARRLAAELGRALGDE